MRTIHVPDLYCPVESRIASNISTAESHVKAWLLHYNLVDETSLEVYQSQKFVHMTARFYPGIDLPRLVILSEFYTLLFISDDQLDHKDNFKDKEYWNVFVEQFMTVVTKGVYYTLEEGNYPLAALSDIWQRMIPLSTTQWRSQFINSLHDMYSAAFWENENLSSGKIISLSQYMQKRQFLGAANIATDCITFAYPTLQLSANDLKNPIIHRMTELCRNTICWSNDLFSLGKELEHGGIHNLVLLIQKEYKISMKTAIQRTVAIHDNDVQLFYSLWRDLILVDENAYSHINTYIESLVDLMGGNIYWSTNDTNRYYNYSYGKSKVVRLPILVTSH